MLLTDLLHGNTHLVAVVAGLVTRTAGYHQNSGTGADGAGPHQSDISAEAGVDVSGRAGAFPLFALVWGLNLSRHVHIRQSAINRRWSWAVIAQFAYYLAGFPWYEGNILFAFAVAAQVLTWCEMRTWWRSAGTMLLLAVWLPLSGTSYGVAGLLMLAVSYRLYRAEDRTERLVLVACLLAVIPALNLATSDAAAVAGLVMTVLTVGLVSCAGKSLPRFWPGDFSRPSTSGIWLY